MTEREGWAGYGLYREDDAYGGHSGAWVSWVIFGSIFGGTALFWGLAYIIARLVVKQ